jgi:phosphohistidine phosphatase
VPAGKQLFVLRHAKSSWDDPVLDDHERPLSGRGRKAVELLAVHVRAAGIAPSLILCSSARRTRETVEAVLPDREVQVETELYDTGCDDLIARLQRIPTKHASVMLVGHNPALQMLVLKLAGANGHGHDYRAPEPDSPLANIGRKFPTGALATLALDGAWAELGPGRAKVVEYVWPKALV